MLGLQEDASWAMGVGGWTDRPLESRGARFLKRSSERMTSPSLMGSRPGGAGSTCARCSPRLPSEAGTPERLRRGPLHESQEGAASASASAFPGPREAARPARPGLPALSGHRGPGTEPPGAQGPPPGPPHSAPGPGAEPQARTPRRAGAPGGLGRGMGR